METQVLEWFQNERGISPETLGAFGVSQEGEFLRFPYSNGTKSRLDPTVAAGRDRGFRFTKGVTPSLFTDAGAVGTKQMFLVEGETDCMRLYQELDGKVTVCGLSGINGWRSHFVDDFKSADRVFVILDNDEDYNVQSTVESTWRTIRADLGAKARRVILPAGSKDVCEFFSNYDVQTFRELCKRAQGAQSKFAKLDLTKRPPEIPWVVDELIAEGDVNLLIGEPNLGKSWLSMALSVAVADRGETWLGRGVHKHGRVLYVDEENPEDVIYTRFRKLGLTEAGARNITYLHRPGVWMNQDPDAFIDEAMELDPVLIVLDSLSRVHSEDENSANAMAHLFRTAIQPLARDTGAAVVVIHHTTKSDTANSFQRSRGSGDITAVVDAAMDVRGTTLPGKFTVSQYKSRRRLGGEVVTVQLKDTPEGRVELVASGPGEFSF